MVYSRKKDVGVVREAVKGAKRQYNEISGRDVEVEVESTLSDEVYDMVFWNNNNYR